MSAATEVDVARGWRSRTIRFAGYDGFRGLAILFMVVDHLCVVLDGPVEVRYTVGRLAMPMFFLLAGHLCRRLSWRHAGVWVVGVLLPVAVPWIDNPNVLTYWALGCVLLVVARWAEVPVWLLAALGLTLAANGWVDTAGIDGAVTYEATALWGLMALGAMLPASAFAWAARVPRWVAVVGSYPLTIYVGHLLVLQGVSMAL